MEVIQLRSFRTRGLAGVLGLAVAAALAGCGGGSGSHEAAAGPPAAVDAAGWKTIEEGANSEGRLVAYVSLTGMDPVFADFMRDYPGIKVTVSQVPTADLLPRLDQELSVGAKGADVTFHASPGWFVDNSKAGNFSTLKLGPEAQESGAVQRVGDTNFAGVYGFPNVISYRTSQPKPENIKQLLDANPQAKIGLVDPGRSSPAVAYQYKVLQDAYGNDIMQRLSKANVTVVPSNPQLTEGIASGAFDYAYPDIASITQKVIDKGAPVSSVVPADKSVAGVHYNTAILRTAVNTNAAEVFVNWLMSERGATSLTAHLKPAVTPVKVNGSIGWNDVNTFDVATWTTQTQNDWIAKNFTPYFH